MKELTIKEKKLGKQEIKKTSSCLSRSLTEIDEKPDKEIDSNDVSQGLEFDETTLRKIHGQ